MGEFLGELITRKKKEIDKKLADKAAQSGPEELPSKDEIEQNKLKRRRATGFSFFDDDGEDKK